MRKNILLLVLALGVFIFAGCGGSADTGEESERVYDSEIAEILKGTWKLNTSSLEGTATSSNGITKFSLRSPIETQIIFGEITFSNTTNDKNDEQAGRVPVFYSQNWQAVDSTDAVVGVFDIRSYTDASEESKFRTMDIVHSDVNEWRISSTTDNAGNSDRINITLTVSSDNEIKLEWKGEEYITQQRARYRYEFEASFRKGSTSTNPKNLSDYSYDTDEENEKIIEILTGTWKVTNPYKKIDVDFTEGGNLLLISSDITFTDIELNGDTGTAIVSVDQYWRVGWDHKEYVRDYYDYDVGRWATRLVTYQMTGYTSFNIKNRTMNMIRHPNNVNKWRCYFDVPEIEVESGDVESNDMSIELKTIKGTVMNVEITSDNTITVVHEGIVDTPQGYKDDVVSRDYGINGNIVEDNLIIYDQIDFNYIKQ